MMKIASGMQISPRVTAPQSLAGSEWPTAASQYHALHVSNKLSAYEAHRTQGHGRRFTGLLIVAVIMRPLPEILPIRFDDSIYAAFIRPARLTDVAVDRK
jgi:hypothetical protein